MDRYLVPESSLEKQPEGKRTPGFSGEKVDGDSSYMTVSPSQFTSSVLSTGCGYSWPLEVRTP